MSRLRELYNTKVAEQLQKQFGYKNVMEMPKVTKVTLNMGVGEAIGDKKTDRECGSGPAAGVGPEAYRNQGT